MDSQQLQLLKENRLNIVKDLEPNYVLDFLQEDGILTENDAEKISKAPTRRERCQLLLSMLPKRGPSAYGSFQTSLKKSHYDHLESLLAQQGGDGGSITYEKLTFETDDTRSLSISLNNSSEDICPTCKEVIDSFPTNLPRESELFQILFQHGCLLLHNIDPVDLLDCCYQESVLSDDECEEVRVERTRKERCMTFFKQLLFNNFANTVHVLKQALEPKYGFIVAALNRTPSLKDVGANHSNNSATTPMKMRELKEHRQQLGDSRRQCESEDRMDTLKEGCPTDAILSQNTYPLSEQGSLLRMNDLKETSSDTSSTLSDDVQMMHLKSTTGQNIDHHLRMGDLKELQISDDTSKDQNEFANETSKRNKDEKVGETVKRQDEQGGVGVDQPDSGQLSSTTLSGIASLQDQDTHASLGHQDDQSSPSTTELPCPSIVAKPGAISPHHLPNKRLTFAFNHLSTLINQGDFRQFDSLSTSLSLKFPTNHDLMCILGYLNASRDLFQTDFDSAKRHIKGALEIVPKTSNPQYFTVELFTAKARMYITQKRLEKLQNTIDDVLMVINTDPVGCSGRAAGWLYINDGRNKTAQLGILNLSKPGSYDLYNKIYDLAKVSFQKSMEHFSRDGGKDGPFGFGYALCRLVILLLRCGDNGLTMNSLHPLQDDVELAGKHLHHLEHSDIPISKILDMHYCLAKGDYQFRKKNMIRALENAQKAYELATEMNLMEFKEHAHNRVKFLSSRRPLLVEEIDEEEAARILLQSSDDDELLLSQ